MIKVKKSNVVLRVSEEQLQAYLNDGYSKVKVREKKEEKKITIAPKAQEVEKEEKKEEKNDSETKGGKK